MRAFKPSLANVSIHQDIFVAKILIEPSVGNKQKETNRK